MSPQAVIPFGEGFLLGIGLIMGIGPQNTFILQQGVRRRFVFMIALLASLIDGGLILLGVSGAGHVFASIPLLVTGVVVAGAVFLLIYGWTSFGAALYPKPPAAGLTWGGALCRRTVVLSVLAVSLLNPSTYLDTLLVIGGSAARYSGAPGMAFAAGATAASTLWFFLLAFGAARFGRSLHNPRTARTIDAASGAIMWFVAGRLLFDLARIG